MLLTLATALLLLQASPDTTPPLSSAYLDPAARVLVESARERRTGVEGSIRRYRTLAKSRISMGLHALSRDRLFFRCESAVRVDWRRGQGAVMEVLGSRQAVPLVSAKVNPDDDDCGDAVFDPADDRLGMVMSGLIGSDSAFVRHPLAPGSERYYRFRSGDTTTIRLPDSRVIRLLELQLLPRESSPHLVSGSLWLDADSRAVVRAVLRLARPYDFVRDASPEEKEDVPGFIPPLRGTLRFIAIEYGLIDQRWWLPRAVAVEGEGQVGGLARFPLKFEETYSEYEVEGAAPGTLPPLAPTVTFDCKRSGSVNVGSEGGRVERESEPSKELEPLVQAPAGKKVKTGCQCDNGRCFQIDRILPTDSSLLVSSSYLPESIYDEGEGLMTDQEMRQILAQVSQGVPAPWQIVRPTVRLGSLDLWRYNRVEGLSGGVRADLDLGRATADATFRLGFADLSPGAEVGLSRLSVSSRQRLAVFRRLDAVGADDRSLGLGGSLGALLFGRDDGDYYRALGAELERRPAASSDGLTWRAYFEHQSAARKHTDFSVPDLFGDASFRENIHADAADQAGAEITLRTSRGLDPAGWRGSAALSVRGEAGSYGFVRPGLRLLGTAPLPGSLVGSLEAAGGAAFGEVPVQSLWYLGGPATMRGYSGNAARGEAFWRGRAEIARAAPGARIVLFSDAGWAGPRDDVQLDPLLLSAGVGASFLDGLIRFDLAHALREPRGWRFDIHLDGAL
jgi:hypothetical protein